MGEGTQTPTEQEAHAKMIARFLGHRNPAEKIPEIASQIFINKAGHKFQEVGIKNCLIIPPDAKPDDLKNIILIAVQECAFIGDSDITTRDSRYLVKFPNQPQILMNEKILLNALRAQADQQSEQ